MPNLTPRQNDILEIARQDGRVDVEPLARQFNVTPQTIRRDLNELCDMERLDRVHGGATIPSHTVNLAYRARREMALEAKRAIASRTVSMIPNGASIILNIGTTTEEVARQLLNHRDLMVITNNMNVAVILQGAADVELVISGGMVRASDGGIVGAAAIDLIRQFKVDFAVVGASAIDEEGALLDYDYREVRVAKAILDQARQRVLVADHSKFERRAPVRIGHLSDMDSFVTDRDPGDHIRALCEDAGVELITSKSEQSLQEVEAA